MDEWVAKNIGLSRCKGEADLFETKWFDYRDMHPLQATAVFTEEYKRQYANIMLTHGREDFQSAPFNTGLKRVPFHDQSTANKTSLWKARQFADRYCVNYGYFIGTILSIAASRLWDKLPACLGKEGIDPGDASVEEIIKAYFRAKPYTRQLELMAKVKGIAALV